MDPMKFVVKYFSEIAIKSNPVRRRFVSRLAANLRAVIEEIDPAAIVIRHWDKLEVETAVTVESSLAQLVEAMKNCPGISYVLEVVEHPLQLDRLLRRRLLEDAEEVHLVLRRSPSHEGFDEVESLCYPPAILVETGQSGPPIRAQSGLPDLFDRRERP